MSRLYIIFSKTFDKEHKKDTGLKLLNISWSSHLKKGITLAIVISSGKTPSTRDKLYVSGLEICDNDNFRMD